MAGQKRKQPEHESDSEESSSSVQNVLTEEFVGFGSDGDDFDISSALTGRAAAKTSAVGDDEDDEDLAALIRDSTARRHKKDGTKMIKTVKGKSKVSKGEVGGGSFQSMGLHPALLRSLTLRGYKIPTPIQRLAIPPLLASPPRDLVGMARTGSGKTLAYMIPLVQRLGGRHSASFGTRALILVPARELAVQVLKVGKELVRGWSAGEGDHAGDNEESAEPSSSSKKLGLRWGVVVGGEGLDEQFDMITNNPDVIVATPGRLLHLIVEMNLDLRSVQYIVFDEADRLFEMGFETALSEIIHRLPSSRQTLLFSATLPKSLIDFAKAGLQEPKLVRLDADSKISSDLRMAFFSVKQAEKEACLLALLRNVIKVPLRGFQKERDTTTSDESTKAKGKGKDRPHTAPHQTIIFTATKHHVEYITSLLTSAGFSVAHIYGKLDQTARSQQLQRFLQGDCDILVVTDVAARGIDVPVLANVVNYDFPGPGARLFVHRVGRTARAGAKGWAWSFVNGREVPFLLDLQLFLGRPLKIVGSEGPAKFTKGSGEEPFVNSLILGSIHRAWLDEESEYIRMLGDTVSGLVQARDIMNRAQGMYERTQGRASQASYRRAKELLKSGGVSGEASVHPVFALLDQQSAFALLDQQSAIASGATHVGAEEGGEDVVKKNLASFEERAKMEEARSALLRAVSSFSPSETVLEIGNKAKAGKAANSAGNAALMKDRRKALAKARERALPANIHAEDQEMEVISKGVADVEMANEDDIEAAFGSTGSKSSGRKFRDSEFYMSHFQKDAITNKGYSLRDGASFAEQAQGATFELADDDGKASRQKLNQVKWDKKKKKFIKGDGVGADNMKLVKTESGARLPATYRSGRFEEWKAKTHKCIPRVGEAELPSVGGRGRHDSGKRFKHHKSEDAKPLDKMSLGYERKVRQLKNRESNEESGPSSRKPAAGVRKSGRYAGKTIGKVKSELKSAEQIRKNRAAVEKRKAKNARPSRKKGTGRR